jgi:hypothetical protein
MEPNNVYINNWYEAVIFLFLEPHIPIKRNIGITINSKKTKKLKKSKELKTLIKVHKEKFNKKK